MTAYELIDLRRSCGAEISTTFRFWVSVTFALLAAAHVAGSSMGLAGVIAATALYATITFITATTIKRFRLISIGLRDDSLALASRMEEAPNALTAVTQTTFGFILWVVQSVGFAGTIAYVLLKAGFIG